MACPQAVTELRGDAEHADARRVAPRAGTHVDVGLHQAAQVVQRVQGSQELGRGQRSEARRGSEGDGMVGEEEGRDREEAGMEEVR